MALILGKEYCKVDSNGRFKFPIALKRQLETEDGRFVIRQSIYAECLELWTYASFREEVEKLQEKLNPYRREDRELLRKLTEGNIIELDSPAGACRAEGLGGECQRGCAAIDRQVHRALGP